MQEFNFHFINFYYFLHHFHRLALMFLLNIAAIIYYLYFLYFFALFKSISYPKEFYFFHHWLFHFINLLFHFHMVQSYTQFNKYSIVIKLYLMVVPLLMLFCKDKKYIIKVKIIQKQSILLIRQQLWLSNQIVIQHTCLNLNIRYFQGNIWTLY